LQQFLDKAFEHTNSTEQAIRLLDKFSQIKEMHLDLESKHQTIFNYYVKRDLDGVRKLYVKHREKPPVPRNAPPVAG
jgi:dynein heavy chain